MAVAVGLDIGSHAVRAAEVGLGRGDLVLRRFGQVTLPIGAVEHGEVVDAPALVEALRRLWEQAGFSTRRVVIGAATPRVVVRIADLPDLPDDDLRASLEFQAEGLLPMPVEQSYLDLRRLGPSSAGKGLTEVLMVGAHHDVVDPRVRAALAARLEPILVDPSPFALVRVTETPDPLAAGPQTVGVVDVGGGITTVVVHHDGVPRFVRIFGRGGDDVTRRLADELDLDWAEAEAIKRSGPLAAPPGSSDRVADLLDAAVSSLVDEVASSLDFHRRESDDPAVTSVRITGGGSRLSGLAAQLETALGVEVSALDPLAALRVAGTGLDDEQLAAATDVMATAIGLAMAADPPARGEHRITLLPPQLVGAQAARRQGVMVGAGVAALAVALLGLWGLRQAEVGEVRDEARSAENDAETFQRQIDRIPDVRDLERQVQDRLGLVEAALADDVAWTRLLQEVATVIPSDVWLTAFDGSAVDDSLTIAGQGFEHTSAARWLLRLGELRSVDGLWLPGSVRSELSGREVVAFSSTARLTDTAQSSRVERFRDR